WVVGEDGRREVAGRQARGQPGGLEPGGRGERRGGRRGRRRGRRGVVGVGAGGGRGEQLDEGVGRPGFGGPGQARRTPGQVLFNVRVVRVAELPEHEVAQDLVGRM